MLKKLRIEMSSAARAYLRAAMGMPFEWPEPSDPIVFQRELSDKIEAILLQALLETADEYDSEGAEHLRYKLGGFSNVHHGIQTLDAIHPGAVEKVLTRAEQLSNELMLAENQALQRDMKFWIRFRWE